MFKLLFVSRYRGFTHYLHSKSTSMRLTSISILQQSMIENLEKHNIECKVVAARRYVGERITRLPILNMSKKRHFAKLLDEFEPDAVILDSPNELGPIVARRKIPLLVYFWDDWLQDVYATSATGRKMSLPVYFWNRWLHRKRVHEDNTVFQILKLMMRPHIIDPCLKSATVILAETDSVAASIREHYPESCVATFPYTSLDTDYWKREGAGDGDAMDLRHPCVGLLQNADWWPKAREMLVLPRVMEALPHVTFYWAGDGRYRDRVLAALSGHDNFKWLGTLEYPDKFKEYVSSIDIYGLASCNDMSPYSMKHAMSMERPTIATDVGGISDTVRDGETGFLVRQGDHTGWTEKISLLLGDAKMARDMGKQGRRFVQDNWDNSVAAERLVGILEGIKSQRHGS